MRSFVCIVSTWEPIAFSSTGELDSSELAAILSVFFHVRFLRHPAALSCYSGSLSMKASRRYVSHTARAVSSEKRPGSKYNNRTQTIKGWSATTMLSDRGVGCDMRGTGAGTMSRGGIVIIAAISES